MSEKPKLIVVAGPTASGKTACAVELCKRIDGEVVSCDSMQIYRGMDILSAMPTKEEMQGIPHHMLGIADPSEKYSAAMYREKANDVIADIHARGKQAVVCGGTGLYINALTRPLSFSQRSDEKLHDELMTLADQPGGRRKLHEMLEEVDPESAARLHENDVRRVARALEIFKLTGVTQTEQAKIDAQCEGDYDETIFALDWPRDVLYQRISDRVDKMIASGLIAEVLRLMQDEEHYSTAAQAIGYKEIAAGLMGRMEIEESVLLVKQVTRNFAKRQLTWFRHDPRTIWIPAQGRSVSQIVDDMIEKL